LRLVLVGLPSSFCAIAGCLVVAVMRCCNIHQLHLQDERMSVIDPIPRYIYTNLFHWEVVRMTIEPCFLASDWRWYSQLGVIRNAIFSVLMVTRAYVLELLGWVTLMLLHLFPMPSNGFCLMYPGLENPKT
jgi:hypothetical protein